MKTTVDISDALLEEARKTASKQGTTVRSLIEQGLRQVLGKYIVGTDVLGCSSLDSFHSDCEDGLPISRPFS